MSGSDTQPTQPLPDWAHAQSVPPRRRRAWPWIVTLVIVLGLAIAACFAAEWIARDLVTKAIREQVVSQLALPADQQVDVTVAGVVVPQLIAGRLDQITVSSDQVPIGGIVGDVTAEARDVAIRGETTAGAASATVALDASQLRALLDSVENFPAADIGLAAPDVTMSTEFDLFGIGIPIGVGLTPSAAAGDIVLSPSTLQLGGSEVSAEDLREQFGGLADTVLRDWTICIAQYLPAGLTLTQVEVVGDRLVADVDIDPAIVDDPALRSVGTCD